MSAERTAWLRLARSDGVGPVTFFKLIERFGEAAVALDALPDLARKAGRVQAPRIPSRDEAEREIAATEDFGARIVTAAEPGYPRLLLELDPPPPVLTLMGPLDLDRPACAIVGSRNASAIGMKFARELAQGLGARGVTVVSGLARGIDGAAHTGALETGTAAVLAGGINHVYPPEHAGLQAEIARHGCLVTESPFSMSPTAKDFPRRNRIISGLSLGTVVVEAALKSGSLITARLAAEQNREVMATPGSPLDPRAKGTNKLIREGAALIESADDVLDILGQLKRRAAEEDREGWTPPPAPDLPPEDEIDTLRERIAGLLSPSPVSIDELSRAAGCPVQLVMAALVELELAGRAEIAPGGQVRSV